MLLTLPLAACGGADDDKPVRHAFEHPCMGTLFRVVLYSDRPAGEIEDAVEGAFEIANQVDTTLSDYKADSEVGRFNSSPPGETQKASGLLAEVYTAALELQRETGGAFDPARGALSWQWRLARRTGELPAPEKLAAALAASGVGQIQFDPTRRQISRRSSMTRLDFGGIAKGFAADRMLEHLRTQGFPQTSVAAGGDIVVGEAPPGERGWRVELRPFGDSAQPGPSIEIVNAACSTSGSVEQAVEIAGTRYSHILDPETGLGMTAARAATVIATTGAESDALATALCLAGEPGIQEFIVPRTESAGIVFQAAEGAAGPQTVAASPQFERYLTDE